MVQLNSLIFLTPICLILVTCGLCQLLYVVYTVGNSSDLEFDLTRSLKVDNNGTGRLPIYDILFVPNTIHMPTFFCVSHRLAVIGA